MGQTKSFATLNLPKLFRDVKAGKTEPKDAVRLVRDTIAQAYVRCPRCTGPLEFGFQAEPETPEDGIGNPEALEAPPPGTDEIGQVQDRRGIEIDMVKAEELRSRWEGTTVSPETPWAEVHRTPGTYRFQIFSDDTTGEPTNDILNQLIRHYGEESTLWLDAAETHLILSDRNVDRGSAYTKIADYQSGWPWR